MIVGDGQIDQEGDRKSNLQSEDSLEGQLNEINQKLNIIQSELEIVQGIHHLELW